MYQRVLKAKETDHISSLQTANNLGNLYADNGRLKDVEKMYQHALKGKEKVLGLDHISTLSTVQNLGFLYADQDKLLEAEDMLSRALVGFQTLLGHSHQKCKLIIQAIHSLHRSGQEPHCTSSRDHLLKI